MVRYAPRHRKRKFIRGHLVRSLKFWKSRKTRAKYEATAAVGFPCHLVNRQEERVYGGKNCTDDTEEPLFFLVLAIRPCLQNLHAIPLLSFSVSPLPSLRTDLFRLPSFRSFRGVQQSFVGTIINPKRKISKLLPGCLPANRIWVFYLPQPVESVEVRPEKSSSRNSKLFSLERVSHPLHRDTCFGGRQRTRNITVESLFNTSLVLGDSCDCES